MKFSGKWDFDPAPESVDHISLKDQYGLFINGKFENPQTSNYFPSINPANEEHLSMIAEAGEKDINAAVSAARKAFDGPWSKMSAKERGKLYFQDSQIDSREVKRISSNRNIGWGKTH